MRGSWWIGRVGSALLTMLGVSILIFAAVRAMPGSYSSLVLGPLATPAQKAQAAAQFGVHKSLPVQFLDWLGNGLRGNFGTSMVSGHPVRTEIASRLAPTVTLTVLALVVTLAVGVPLGVVTGSRGAGGGLPGRLGSTVGISLPDFALGSVVVFVFSRYSLWLPSSGYVSWSQGPLESLKSLLLPALVLAVFCTAATARITRDSVRRVLAEPHIRAAVARGESRAHILRTHVVRNASVPVLTLVATLTAYLLGGAVIVEQLFDVPGLGSYLVLAMQRRDYAVIQACVLLATAVFVTVSLLIDLGSGVLDPRVSTRARRAVA